MKNSKALLLEYLASVRDPERAASLFADDGAFELPFLRSLGVGSRYTGRGEITALTSCSNRSDHRLHHDVTGSLPQAHDYNQIESRKQL